MTKSTQRFLSGLAMLVLIAGLAAPAWSASRGGGGARGGAAGGHSAAPRAAPRSPAAAPRSAPRAAPSRPSTGSATARSTAPRTAPRQPASGQATYGHGGGYYGGYYPGGWYGYGYPWYSLDFYWGWGWPWYGTGYPYYPPNEEPIGEFADRGPARIELDVAPRRANLLVDGEPAGRVKDWDGRWDRLPVDPGDRVLTFEAPGYKTLRIRVNAESGGSYRVAYDLAAGEGSDSRSTSDDVRAPAPSEAPQSSGPRTAGEPESTLVKGFLRFNVKPADAAVYLDGAFFARADELARLRGAVPLAAGTHAIEVVRPGYESAKVNVEVVPDRPSEVVLELQKSR